MKAERHAKVIELIRRYDIETQEDLADRLNSEGYNVTQATVSRDIRELKLTKVSNGAGKQKYNVEGKTSEYTWYSHNELLTGGANYYPYSQGSVYIS